MIKWKEAMAETGLGGRVVVLGKTGPYAPTRVIAEVEHRPRKGNVHRCAVFIAGEEGLARYSRNIQSALVTVAKHKHIAEIKIKPGTIGEFYGAGPIKKRQKKSVG